MWRCLRTCMSACIRMIWPNRACRSPPVRRSTVSAVPIFCWSISGKTADPLQLPDQHVERLGQHHTAALREPFRNDNALLRWVEALQCGMQQESLAPIVCDAASLRHHQKIGFQTHDRLQRGVSAKLEAE